MSNQTFVVSVSGGLTSFEAWRRCLEKHGPERTVPIFADVGQVFENGVCVSGEDEDLYRFLDESEQLLGQKIIRLKSEKFSDVWDCFFKQRFLGNSRIDPCSKYLKREVINKWVKANYSNGIRVIGFSWLESSRAERYKVYFPDTWFPLLEPPYVTSEEIGDWLEARGVQRPRLYNEGFIHNNCGGMCVKMGLGQLYDLWKSRPERYSFNERMEQKFREEISEEATIFKKSEVPVTMKEMRELFEQGCRPDTAQYYSCGGRCMIPEQGEIFPRDEFVTPMLQEKGLA